MPMRGRSATFVAIAVVLVACDSSLNSLSPGGFSDSVAGGDDRSASPPSAGASTPNADGGLASEKEVESDYAAPIATGNVVWIANPKSGRVALVDAATLAIRTVEAGNAPTYVASVPGRTLDTTLVLNVDSQDATLLEASATNIQASTMPTAAQANSMAFSSDGRFAIAWADASKIASAREADGFQDLAVLDLVAKTSTILAVGYRPVTVGFGAGSPRAFAVTQDGVALIDLTAAPIVKKNVAISSSPTEDPGTRDVFVTKDATQAFIRRDGSSAITVVNLDADTRTDVTLSGSVTDMDVTDTGDRAVAVVRDTAEVAVLPVANPAAKTSTTVTGETIGSVALTPGGVKALLYTNAIASERFTVFDLGAAAGASPLRTIRVYSPVLGLFPSPDSQYAVVLHDDTGGPNGTPGAFSVVPIGQDLPGKIQATQAPPTAVAVEATRAIVAERSDSTGVYGAYLARMPELRVDRYPLASPPIAVGIIAGANRAYVAQQNPDGRITFIDLDSGLARTLTGFELAARVVDGSQP
jgi:hypothetical protein